MHLLTIMLRKTILVTNINKGLKKTARKNIVHS